ncbi:MAG TPA: Coq4 family protein, partial [Nannocystis sp.]
MLRWSEIREINQAVRDGRSTSDIAALKFAMLAGSKNTGSEGLHALRTPCLEVDLAALRGLPEGTVGREYARLLDSKGLEPLRISEDIKARLAGHPLALRYTTTHDLVHVLTGFSTTPAGELGVLAFMVGQGAASRPGLLWWSAIVGALVMPLHVPSMWHNIRVGLKMAREARPVLEAPLEELLAVPLQE